jgi:apolipoprotein N-acyltransferase
MKNKNIYSLLLMLAILGLPLLYGGLRMNKETGKTIRLGIVQPNIDPNLKFTKAMREETFNRLIHLSEECVQRAHEKNLGKLDMIIWPETATPIFLTFPGTYQNRIYELCNRINVLIFTGTPIYERKDKEIYNGAVLIEPKKGITQKYKKMHLVPFGEHIPFDQYIACFKKIDVGGGDYAPGHDFTVFHYSDFSFSCLICFESIFPELSHVFAQKGTEMLINITNDGWFGKISGPQQHNDMAIMRTVENSVPLARSANTGISMFVDKHGRVLDQTGLFQKDVLVASLWVSHEKTIFQRFGYGFPIWCLLVVTGLLFWKILTIFLRK